MPTEALVPDLGTYLPPQPFLVLHVLRWGLSWSGTGPMAPMGSMSVVWEPSYFSMLRVLKEKVPSGPCRRERLCHGDDACVCVCVCVYDHRRPRSLVISIL